MSKIIIKIIVISVIFLLSFEFYKHGRSLYMPVYYKIFREKSMTNTVQKISIPVEKRIQPYFTKSGFDSLPKKITFLAFKEEKRLEVWGEKNSNWYFVRDYPILAASGKLGPKLKEGDKQVPEGIYNITFMNPNSKYYLAMLIDYPNNFDKQKAKLDRRTNLGGDICIHGKNVSAGCLAVGDDAIEELFYEVDKVGMSNVNVIIAPYDFRKHQQIIYNENSPKWTSELYSSINNELKKYQISN